MPTESDFRCVLVLYGCMVAVLILLLAGLVVGAIVGWGHKRRASADG